jgi:O-antigen ligase
MIRYTLLGVVISFLVVYAWRDWFRTLCALIVLMAVVEHPDMPKSIMGIPGMNPWNLVLLSVLLSWLAHRRVEDLRFDFPPRYKLLLFAYAGIIVISFCRGIVDTSGIVELYLHGGFTPPSIKDLTTNNLVNAFKWAIPGLLVFSGARTTERQHLALIAMIAVCFLLGVQILRWMPISLLADGEQLSERAIRLFDREIGYHRVDLAALTAGGFWAMMNYRAALNSRFFRLLLLAGALILLIALALTGGRAGYGTWVALGMFFAVMRSKVYLMVAPLVAVVVLLLVPAAMERMAQGFDEESVEMTLDRFDDESLVIGGVDMNTVTSGRALAWPFVIDEIAEAPWLGHGQMAMQREGITLEIALQYGNAQSFPHPHNAYLELVLDNGIIGAIPVLLFYALVVLSAIRSLRDHSHPLEAAFAATALAFIGAHMIASIGSQSFYPRAGTVVMFCAIGLQLRMLVQKSEREASSNEESVAPAVRRPRARAPSARPGADSVRAGHYRV